MCDIGRKKPRVPSDFILSRIAGGYLVTFRDHASHQKKVFQLDTLETLLETIEEHLRGGLTDWQPYKSFLADDPGKEAEKKN